MIHLSRIRLQFYLFSLCIVSSVCSFTYPPAFRSISGRRAGRHLFTSLSAPPSSSSSEPSIQNESDGGVSSGENYNERRRNLNTSSPSHHFRMYLRKLRNNLRSSRICACVMDDELERMELKWYGGESKGPPRYTGKPREYYRGATVEPDISCYAMVANAYSKAGMGKEGALLAEQVLHRCEEHVERHGSSQEPNTLLWTAVMNAWARADQWDEADSWLAHIEDTYAKTHQRLDAPDVITYSTYLEALSMSRRKHGNQIAREAKDVLERMHQMADKGDNVHARPNTFSYLGAIKCQARANDIEAVEGLLRRLQKIYQETGDESFKPGTMAYMPVLNAFSRCRGGIEAARRADSLKEELHELYEQTGDRDYHPHDGVYTSVISAYARVEPEEQEAASKRVDELLEQLENDPAVRRSVHCYTAAINAKTQDGLSPGPEEAETILRRMPHPDAIAYQCVITAYARGEGNAERAEALLNEMNDLAETGSLPHRASVVTHAACSYAWVEEYNQTFRLHALERADAILHRIVGFYRDGLVHFRERNVDIATFNTVLQTWARSRHSEAGERAEKLLAAMEEVRSLLGNEGEMYIPFAKSYTYALDAWAGSGHPDAGKRSMDLLQRMRNLHAENEFYPAPNSRSLSSVLTSVTKTGGLEAAEIAEDLLRQRIQLFENGDKSSIPNARTYTSVLGLIVRSHEPGAEKRALKLFREIRDLSDRYDNAELVPNAITYNCVLHGLAKSGEVDEAKQLFAEMKERYKAGRTEEKPGLVTYSTMIEALGKSKEAARRAEELLDEIEELHRDGDPDLKPDTHIYNAVIRTIATSVDEDPKAAERAHNLLKRMELSVGSNEQIVPDLITYSSVCYAYANSNCTDAAQKAHEILQHVESLAETGVISPPDLPLYSIVMLTYARKKQQGSMYEAESLFNRMEDLYKSGRKNLKPNRRVMNQLISGWATSRTRKKTHRANDVLQRMKSMADAGNSNVRPDVHSYNWVIRAAARSTIGSPEDKVESFRIAVDQFKYLHRTDERVRPNASTYIYFLRACKALLPAGDVRDKLIGDTLTLAIRNGMVGDMLFKQIKNLTPEVMKAALQKEGMDQDLEAVNVSDMPVKWRRFR